jgi:hypothetical protein
MTRQAGTKQGRTAAATKSRRRRKINPGPKPEVLKIEGDWRDAVKKSLAKRKPPEGWPK